MLIQLIRKMSLPFKVYSIWRDLMDNKSDPRTTNWFMMSSPFPTMALSLCYIFTVTVSLTDFIVVVDLSKF